METTEAATTQEYFPEVQLFDDLAILRVSQLWDLIDNWCFSENITNIQDNKHDEVMATTIILDIR